MPNKTVILGGGLSAVALAYHLREPVTIIEMERELGGLCRSFKPEDGYDYDIGGHVIFGEQTAVKEMLDMLDGNYAKYERCNKIQYGDKLLDFPFENGTWELSPQERYELAIDYLSNRDTTIKPTNFRDWLLTKYGQWLSLKYLIPFNEKLWKIDLRKVNLDWTERIPDPDKTEIISAICGIKRQGYARLKSFYYPLEGGISKLIEGYKKKSQITAMLGYRIKQINIKHGAYEIVCDTPDGGAQSVTEADKIISTIPLPELARALMNIPDEVYHAVQHIEWLGLNIGYSTSEGKYPDIFAVYNPYKETAWHRLCDYSFFGKPIEVVEMTVNKKDTAQFPYAYPIYTHNRAKDVKTVLDYAKSVGIDCVGRMATMQYLNMDKAINQVKEYCTQTK